MQGLWPNYIKVVPSIALAFTTYELLKEMMGAPPPSKLRRIHARQTVRNVMCHLLRRSWVVSPCRTTTSTVPVSLQACSCASARDPLPHSRCRGRGGAVSPLLCSTAVCSKASGTRQVVGEIPARRLSHHAEAQSM